MAVKPENRIVGVAKKILRPIFVVFGFVLVFFVANSRLSKQVSNLNGLHAVSRDDSGIAHADAPVTGGDSSGIGGDSGSGDCSDSGGGDASDSGK